jgi:hypothetical protein
MKVAVLTKQTANNRMSARIDLRFGDAATLAGRREAASQRPRRPTSIRD